MSRSALVLAVLVPLLTACSASAPGASVQSAAAETPAAPNPTTARPSYALSLPPFASAPATSAPVTGEAPPALMVQARLDLAGRTALDPATFETVRSEQVVWSDGSLGCPQPGYMYVQVVTPGYWIQLAADGKTYDYRATETGPAQLCEQPNPKPPSG